MATLSYKSPFSVMDLVVWCPIPSFLLKVVSAFCISGDIVLSSFCPSFFYPWEHLLHCFDVHWAVYLAASEPFRQSDFFMVIPEGSYRGLSASKCTIASWIWSAIAYRSKGRVPPFSGYRPVYMSSWGFLGSMAPSISLSGLQGCHTGLSAYSAKFYQVHTIAGLFFLTFAHSGTAFGRPIVLCPQ